MTDLEFPQWQTLYLQAARERDPEKMAHRIDAAKGAILLRLRTVEKNSQGRAEWQALQDALEGLPTQKSNVLEFSSYRKLSADSAVLRPVRHFSSNLP